MAREYARLRVSSYDDPDVEALTIEAQWLYYKVLLPHPSLSSCGLMDWRPKKLVRKGSNAGLVKILAAAAELERARFVMFDLETEEVLLRSYVRGDELLKNPKMAGSVVKAYQAVASRELQAALVTEFARVREENPDYSSWSHKDTAEDLSRILSRPDLKSVGYTNAFADQIDYGITDVNAVGITNPNVVPNGYPTSVSETDVDPGPDNPSNSAPIPSTYTRSHKPAPDGGYVTGVRHQGAGDQEPPPRTCPEHPDGTAAACTACGIFRRARLAYDEDMKRQAVERRAAERDAEIETRRRAIQACPLHCKDGYLNGALCDHDPAAAERNARGVARARIAACKLCDDNGDRADGSECAHGRGEKTPPGLTVVQDPASRTHSPVTDTEPGIERKAAGQ